MELKLHAQLKAFAHLLFMDRVQEIFLGLFLNVHKDSGEPIDEQAKVLLVGVVHQQPQVNLLGSACKIL